MDVKRIARLLEKGNNELTINEVILTEAQKRGQILYGSRGFNLQVPNHLRKSTSDYDLLSQKPMKNAREIAEILSRRLGEKLSVSKGSHQGTYRIKTEDGKVIADYTLNKIKPQTKKVYGVKVRSLPSIKRNATRLSKKQGLEYRREKDLDTLSRLKEVERIDRAFDNI